MTGESHMVHFSLMDAYRLGIGYIRRGFQRTAINVASIALANSFLTGLALTDVFYQTNSALEGGAFSVDAYQYWLVAVALIVSVVGITNAMLIAVYERTREIGVRKAIGAKRRAILFQFLNESVFLSLIGGFLGILIGFLLALAVTAIFSMPFAFPVWAVVASFLVTSVVGLFAGIYPAAKASKLDPIEALRYE